MSVAVDSGTPAAARTGPLAGLRVVEFAGLGPGPFACMLLADMGAEVVRIDRPGKRLGDRTDIIGRGREVVLADLKQPADREAVHRLLAQADVLVEGFRPGVMERLGFGPAEVHAYNPRLVYGRITGWGQTGPLAQSAGHDINYIAITGALHALGPAGGAPSVPLNLLGDYAGGSMFLVTGLLAALHERQASGQGQVVDAAITEGTLNLMSLFVSQSLRGSFTEQRGSNLLDGGAPFYGVYETSDGGHLSVGALEPQFFAELLQRLGLPADLAAAQADRTRWPALRAALAGRIVQKTQAEWAALLEGTDACATPVIPLSQAPQHPQLVAREAFAEVDGVLQPAPAPRFSRTPSRVGRGTARQASGLAEVAARWKG